MGNQEQPVQSKASRRWKRLGLIALAIVTGQLLLDGLHAAYVAVVASRWEATVQREANGVMAGCDAFDLAPAGDTIKETAVLLVHGINASPRHYDFVAPALAERGYAVRAMRLPGFGEPLEVYSESRAEDWVAAVSAELSTLRGEHANVGLVGHSLGGAVAIGTLLEDPDAADFAVLLAPAVAVSDQRSPVFSTRTWHEFAQAAWVFTHTLSSPFAMDCHDTARHDHPGGVPFTPIAVVDSLFHLMDRNLPAADRLTTPTVMIVSEADRVVSTSAAVAYFERIGAADKELIRLDDCGHELPLDNEWPALVEAIDQIATRITNEPDPETQSRRDSSTSRSPIE